MKAIFSAAVWFMSVLALHAGVVYTYENDGRTYVATVTGEATSISDEAIAVLSGNEVDTFIKRGEKTLNVDKCCSFAGDVIFEGGSESRNYAYNDMYFMSGAVFGNGEGTIHVKERGLGVAGCEINKKIVFDCGTTWAQLTGLKAYSGESTLKRKVTFSDRNFNIYPYSGSRLTFKGGFEGAGYLLFQESGGGVVEFADEPVSLSYPVTFWEAHRTSSGGYWVEIILSAPGNIFSAFGHNESQKRYFTSCKLSTTVDWAFDNPAMKMHIGADSLWDLCGTSQRVGHLNANSLNYDSSQGTMTVITNSSTAAAATLHLNQTADTVLQVVFGGDLSVDFGGTKTTTVAHEMTAVGELSVSGGKLVFGKDGRWPASKVSIADGASMEISSGSTFRRETELSLSGTGALAIAAGEGGVVVTQTVEFLTVDGVAQERGFYQMGDGVLEVLYSSGRDIADETLILSAGERLKLDESVKCGIFDSIMLGDGAELEIATDIYFPENAEFTIVIGEGGGLKLAEGIDLFASAVTVGGVPLKPGRYTAENSAWLTGGGCVYVPYGAISGTDVRWVAAGADFLMTTLGNWSDENVDLDNGTAYARFVAGKDATVSGTHFLNGMSFETADAFTVSAADENSFLRLASGGISSVDLAVKISSPLHIDGSQTWNFAKESTVSGAVNSDALSRYTLTVNGPLVLSGGGNFAGDIRANANIRFTGGKTYGNGSGTIAVASKKTMVLQNAQVDKDIFFDNFNGGWNDNNLSIWEGRSGISGKVTFGNRNFHINAYVGSDTVFSGGVEDADSASRGYLILMPASGGRLVFEEKPIVIGNGMRLGRFNTFDKDGFAGYIVFAAVGNMMPTLGFDNGASDGYFRLEYCKMQTTVDRAFDNPDMKVYLGGGSVWDLCGTCQRTGQTDVKIRDGFTPVITNSSESAATLCLNRKTDEALEVVFGGNLNVDFSGAKTTSVTRRMTATGDVTVNGGVLQFDSAGSWRDASTVTINGGAKLVLAASRNLGRKTRLVLASASSLEIAAGAAVRVASLCVGGVEYRIGRYRFGDGELVVGPQGFKMIVR